MGVSDDQLLCITFGVELHLSVRIGGFALFYYSAQSERASVVSENQDTYLCVVYNSCLEDWSCD